MRHDGASHLERGRERGSAAAYVDEIEADARGDEERCGRDGMVVREKPSDAASDTAACDADALAHDGRRRVAHRAERDERKDGDEASSDVDTRKGRRVRLLAKVAQDWRGEEREGG
jgi:hypothetical protein